MPSLVWIRIKLKINAHIILIGLIFFFAVIAQANAQKAEVIFEIPEADLIPEGIAYDSKNQRFYVSSTYRRKIVEVNAQGMSRDFVAQAEDGLLGVVGMRVDTKRRRLWALSGNVGLGMPMINPDTEEGVSRVHLYDVDTRKLIRKFELSNPGEKNFLNDLTIANNGDVYLTDTQAKRIYHIANGSNKLELLVQLDSSMSPNGIDISPDQDFLFVAVYGGKNVIRLNLKTLSYKPIQLPDGEQISADGLYFYKNSLIAIQPRNENRITARYYLDDSYNEVTRVEVISNDNPHFSQPTTGVIDGNRFFCIANSQLQLFRRIYDNGNYQLSDLKNPVVLRFDLK